MRCENAAHPREHAHGTGARQQPWCGDSLSPVGAPLSARPERPRPVPAQSESEQRPHKLSYYCDAKGAEAEALIKQLEERLAAAGVRAKVPGLLVVRLICDVSVVVAIASTGAALPSQRRRSGKHQRLSISAGMKCMASVPGLSWACCCRSAELTLGRVLPALTLWAAGIGALAPSRCSELPRSGARSSTAAAWMSTSCRRAPARARA